MKDKSKGKIDESSHSKSSVSELKSLGSTSSITIPKASPAKKIGLSLALVLGLGGGGYYAASTDAVKNLINPQQADDMDEKDTADAPVPADGSSAEETPSTPDGQTTPEVKLDEAPAKAADVPPVIPMPPPIVQQAVPTPVVQKAETPLKTKVTKANAKKTYPKKAIVSKKTKKAKAIAKLKSTKKAKVAAKKKTKAKKPIASQANVAPVHP